MDSIRFEPNPIGSPASQMRAVSVGLAESTVTDTLGCAIYGYKCNYSTVLHQTNPVALAHLGERQTEVVSH
jgi:hypothetical protein